MLRVKGYAIHVKQRKALCFETNSICNGFSGA
jgi:hypothetical protein